MKRFWVLGWARGNPAPIWGFLFLLGFPRGARLLSQEPDRSRQLRGGRTK